MFYLVMDLPENLLCVTHAELVQRNGEFVVEFPQEAVESAGLQENDLVKLAVVQPSDFTLNRHRNGQRSDHHEGQPVDEGDTIEVEIDNFGDQGDGIARTPEGYVIMVEDDEIDIGDRPRVEITDVRSNFAKATVIENPDATRRARV